jgi:hypothetical protein
MPRKMQAARYASMKTTTVLVAPFIG